VSGNWRCFTDFASCRSIIREERQPYQHQSSPSSIVQSTCIASRLTFTSIAYLDCRFSVGSESKSGPTLLENTHPQLRAERLDDHLRRYALLSSPRIK
jgi:hypothetical protein